MGRRGRQADAAARIGDVAVVARDHVDVEVGDRLTAGGGDVDANVPAVGVVRGIEVAADVVDEAEDGELLVWGGVEPGGDGAFGDDERVAGGDGVAIADGEGEGVGGDPGRRGEEEERRRRGVFGHAVD